MMSNAIFGDIAEVIMGQSPKGVDVNTDGLGIPLLNGPTEFSSRYPAPVQYTTEGRKFSEEGDILFCVRGSTTGRMNYADQSYAIGRGIAAIRGKNGYPTSYVRAVIERNLDRLLVSATGSTFPNVGRDLLLNFEVEIVPKEESLSINELLVSLEEKIELNRQTNQNLEQIAQAIFKSWFVDFEPTRAKIAAKKRWLALNETAECSSPTCYAEEFDGTNQNENASEKTSLEDAMIQAATAAISGKTIEELQELRPEQQQQLRATADLFPDALVDSELGEVPEGWGIKNIKELAAKISKGTTPRKSDIQKSEDAEIIPFLKVRDISDNGEIKRRGLDNIPESIHSAMLKRSILKTNDILFSIAGTIGRVALVEDDLTNSNCNQALAFIRLAEPEKHLDLCRLNLVGNRVQNEVNSKIIQGVQANFSLTGLGEIEILVPDDDFLNCFNVCIRTIAAKQNLLLSENRKLSELRDSLLPKLLSGKLSTVYEATI